LLTKKIVSRKTEYCPAIIFIKNTAYTFNPNRTVSGLPLLLLPKY